MCTLIVATLVIHIYERGCCGKPSVAKEMWITNRRIAHHIGIVQNDLDADGVKTFNPCFEKT